LNFGVCSLNAGGDQNYVWILLLWPKNVCFVYTSGGLHDKLIPHLISGDFLMPHKPVLRCLRWIEMLWQCTSLHMHNRIM